MNEPKTFEELIESIHHDIAIGHFRKDIYVDQAKRIHQEHRNRFIKVMVIKKIERVFIQERRTMDTRSKEEQNLIGAYLNVSEQNFKNEVKPLMAIIE